MSLITTNLFLSIGAFIAVWALLRLLGNERERLQRQATPPSPAPAAPVK